jgi:hypothetical protein
LTTSSRSKSSRRRVPVFPSLMAFALGELALHAPVPPPRIVRRHADHELADPGCCARSSGTPPGQHHQTAQQTAREQVDDREDHPAMISAREPRRRRQQDGSDTRSRNRAPTGWPSSRSAACLPAPLSPRRIGRSVVPTSRTRLSACKRDRGSSCSSPGRPLARAMPRWHMASPGFQPLVPSVGGTPATLPRGGVGQHQGQPDHWHAGDATALSRVWLDLTVDRHG